MKGKLLIALLFLSVFVHNFNSLAAQPDPTSPKEIVLDAVIASVDGKAITLIDLIKRLPTQRKLTLKEASSDFETRQLLESMIMERLIEAEAEARKISADAQDIEQYIDQVAKANNLSRAEFETLLKKENKDLEQYKQQIRIEILKSRLASGLVNSGVGVSTKDIQDYIKEHPELSKTGSKIKLRQIFIGLSRRSEAEATALVDDIEKKIAAGEAFADLARNYSESPDAKDGGLLGVVAESDLNTQIFDAVYPLKDEEVSKPVQTASGYYIFKVEQRFVEKESSDSKLEEEVRKILQQQKIEEKLQNYFTTELANKHAVDKKI